MTKATREHRAKRAKAQARQAAMDTDVASEDAFLVFTVLNIAVTIALMIAGLITFLFSDAPWSEWFLWPLGWGLIGQIGMPIVYFVLVRTRCQACGKRGARIFGTVLFNFSYCTKCGKSKFDSDSLL